jgi:LysM repeat protein
MAAHEWRAPLARYGAPAAFLAAATLAAILIRAGLKSGDNPKPATTSTVTESVAQPANPLYYRIRNGDTLGAVAERFGTTVEDLVALNPQVDPNALTIGQRLRVR